MLTDEGVAHLLGVEVSQQGRSLLEVLIAHRLRLDIEAAHLELAVALLKIHLQLAGAILKREVATFQLPVARLQRVARGIELAVAGFELARVTFHLLEAICW